MKRSLTHQTTHLLVAVSLLGGCTQTYYPPVARPGVSSLLTQDQTAIIENNDRVRRLGRLAALQGVSPPLVEQLSLPPGSVNYMNGPVPVVRIVFNEAVFFDSDSDQPRPDIGDTLNIIADNMRRDVPDAAVTILGHTDAQGSDEYNVDLSRRRATNVMRALVALGVNPDQLSEVAIGKRQPIAPNDTPDGRARNRRVEFLVSSGIDANLAAVKQRAVPESYFALNADLPAQPIRLSNSVSVGRLRKGRQLGISRNPVDDIMVLTLPAPVRTLVTPDDSKIIGAGPDTAPLRKSTVPIAQSQPTAAPAIVAPAPSPPVRLAPLEPAPSRKPLNDNEF